MPDVSSSNSGSRHETEQQNKQADVSDHSGFLATLIIPDQPLVLRTCECASKDGATLCNLPVQSKGVFRASMI